jgi:hypothetical protein
MKLFIPELGTQLQLTKAHSFKIEYEQRNNSIIADYSPELWTEYQKLDKDYWNIYYYFNGTNRSRTLSEAYEALKKFKNEKPCFITLPKNTVLEVDRIYIRQGSAQYSSVTFKIRGKKVLRFWLTLSDVNKIDCNIVGAPDENRAKNIPRMSIGG